MSISNSNKAICLLLSFCMFLSACGQHGAKGMISSLSDSFAANGNSVTDPADLKALTNADKNRASFKYAFFGLASYNHLARLEAFKEFDVKFKTKYSDPQYDFTNDILAQSYRKGIEYGTENSRKAMEAYFGGSSGNQSLASSAGFARNLYALVRGGGGAGAAVGAAAFVLDSTYAAYQRGQNTLEVREKKYFDQYNTFMAKADETMNYIIPLYEQEFKKYKETGVKSGQLVVLDEIFSHYKNISPVQSVEKNLQAANDVINESRMTTDLKENQTRQTQRISELLQKENISNFEFRQGLISDVKMSFGEFGNSQGLENIGQVLKNIEQVQAEKKQVLLNNLEKTKSVVGDVGFLASVAMQAAGDHKGARIIGGLASAGVSFITGVQGYIANVGLTAGLSLMTGVGALVSFAISLSSRGGDGMAEILKQLQLMADFLQQFHKEMHERFDRVDRNLAQMMNLLISTFSYQNQILAGLRDNMEEVQRKLNDQINMLEQVKSKIDATYQEVLKTKEIGLYTNLEKSILERCILFPKMDKRAPVDLGFCYQSTVSLINTSFDSPQDLPQLLGNVNDLNSQFTGYHEDRLRLLPQALSKHFNLFQLAQFNVPNLTHLNNAVMLSANYMRSNDQFESYRTLIKENIQSAISQLKQMQRSLQDKLLIQSVYDSYAETEEGLLKELELEWRLANQKVINDFHGSDTRTDAKTADSFDSPSVATSICAPVDFNGNILPGAERFDFDKEINRPDYNILDPQQWADVLPDELKRAIYHKKGDLKVCLQNSIQSIRSFMDISDEVRTLEGRLGSGGGKYLYTNMDNTFYFIVVSEVRFVWTDQATQQSNQILSLWFSNTHNFNKKESIRDSSYSRKHHIAGVIGAEMDAPGLTERAQDRTQHVNSPRGRKKFGKYNTHYLSGVAGASRSYINEKIREFFMSRDSGLKNIFKDSYSGSPVSDLVKETNKIFIASLYRNSVQDNGANSGVNDIQNPKISNYLQYAGFKKGVLETVLSTAFPTAFSQESELQKFFADINGISSSMSLLGPNVFFQSAIFEAKAIEKSILEEREKAKPKKIKPGASRSEDPEIAEAIDAINANEQQKVMGPQTYLVAHEHPSAEKLANAVSNQKDIQAGVENVIAGIKILKMSDMIEGTLDCTLAARIGANAPTICPNPIKNKGYAHIQYFFIPKKEIAKNPNPARQVNSRKEYLDSLIEKMVSSEESFVARMRMAAKERKNHFANSLNTGFESWIKTENESAPQVTAVDWLNAVVSDSTALEKAVADAAKLSSKKRKKL